MSKKSLALVAVITALALFAFPMTATAGGVAAAVFVGKGQVGTPLCYPVVCGNPPAGAVPWSFAAGANFPNANGTPSLCAGATVSLPTKAAKSLQAGTCDIVSSGTLTGIVPGTVGPWCGHSVGTGTGSLTFNKVKSFALSIQWISAGSNIILLGSSSKGGQTGPFVSVINANPDRVFKGQSCTPPGASQFQVVGIGVGLATGTK